jgi:uncharacterized membrane protein YqjE
MESETNGRSLGELFKTLTNDLSTLVRSEIALAKLEIKQSLTRLGLGGAFFLLAALLAAGASVLLLVTLILVLAIWIPAWASTLIIAVLMLLMGGLFVFLGKKKMENLDFVPEATIENVRSDIETLKGARKRS